MGAGEGKGKGRSRRGGGEENWRMEEKERGEVEIEGKEKKGQRRMNWRREAMRSAGSEGDVRIEGEGMVNFYNACNKNLLQHQVPSLPSLQMISPTALHHFV